MSSLFRADLFQGQLALVTGGATGIGASIAFELASLGATVVIASRKPERLQAAARALSQQTGGKVAAMVLDIRDREAVERSMAALIQQHGRLDLLVNNGGGQFLAPASAISPRGWDAVVQTNLTGTWNLTRAAADHWMFEHGGCILSITMLTSRGFPGMAHSVSARAGVEALTRTLAVEWARHGIRLNCVAPGLIVSNGLRNYPDGLELARQMQSTIPMKRLGACEDISRLIAFLASPGGSYITGQTFTVDGGRSLWGDGFPIPDPDVLPEIQIPHEPWEE